MHVNGIDYNEGFDQIIISIHNFNEVWILDHSTTTAEATSHSGGNCGKGGDLLYRWGNPEAYDAGTASDQIFYGQHNAHWIPKGLKDEGKIMVFNNGAGRPNGNYSSVEIFVPPIDSNTFQYSYTSGQAYLPTASEWIYTANPKETFNSNAISGAHRLDNGNTLICSGNQGTIFEINADSDIVWKYVVPLAGSTPLTQGQTPNMNNIFRCYRYSTDYSGLSGKILTPLYYIELDPDTSLCVEVSGIDDNTKISGNINIFPNPSTNNIHISSSQKIKNICLVDEVGRVLYRNLISALDYDIDITLLKNGIYFLQINGVTNKLIVKQ